jgi:hypothetical protein
MARTSTSFKKGDKRNKGRPAGAENRLTAEFKDMLVRAFNERGGFDRFLKWIGSSKDREDIFYGRMMIKLLPMNLKVESHKDVINESTDTTTLRLARFVAELQVRHQLCL